MSIRYIMYGECFLFSVLSLWTVLVFPMPQQFQLNTAKEAEDDRPENPSCHFEKLQAYNSSGLVEEFSLVKVQ